MASIGNKCVTCQARSGQPCVTLTTGRKTKFHRARIVRKVRVIPAQVPDPRIGYGLTQRPNRGFTASAVDTLGMLGYSRSKSIALLTDH